MLNYLNTKSKAFVVFVFSLSFMGIFMMIIAIPFHWNGKKMPWGYLASFIINSVASGFVVSAYYLKNQAVLNIYELLIATIPAAAIVFLVYLMLQNFNKAKKITITVAGIINAVLTITAIVFWIMHGNVVFSFGFFCSLISFFYLCVFGITINHDERSVLRDISFGSFVSFIIISVVVIFILSEGEILDGFDCFGGGDDTKKRKRSKI